MSHFFTTFEPVLTILRLLGGTPLALDKESNVVKYEKKNFLCRLGIVIAIAILGFGLFAFVMAQTNGFMATTSVARQTGITLFDVVVTMSSVMGSNVASLAYIILLLQRGDELVSLIEAIQHFTLSIGLIEADGATVKKILRKRFLLGLCIVSLLLIISPLNGYLFVVHTFPGIRVDISIIYVISVVLGTAMDFISPVMYASYLTCLFLLLHLVTCLQAIKAKVLHISPEKGESKATLIKVKEAELSEDADKSFPDPTSATKTLLKQARVILDEMTMFFKIYDKVKILLAPYLLIQFATSLYMGTTLTYAEVAILFGNKNWLRFGNTIVFFFVTIFFFVSLYSVCKAGQQLENAADEIRLAVDELFQAHRNMLDYHLKEDWNLLRERLATDVILRPYKCISVNYSGFLSMIGTIGTYLIVLMQFKATE